MGARKESESKEDPGRGGRGRAPAAAQVCVEDMGGNRALMDASPRSANIYPTPPTGSTGS